MKRKDVKKEIDKLEIAVSKSILLIKTRLIEFIEETERKVNTISNRVTELEQGGINEAD